MKRTEVNDRHLLAINPITKDNVLQMARAVIGPHIKNFKFQNVSFIKDKYRQEFRRKNPEVKCRKLTACWVGEQGSEYILYFPFSSVFASVPKEWINCSKIGYLDRYLFAQNYTFFVGIRSTVINDDEADIYEYRVIRRRVMKYKNEMLVFVEDRQKEIYVGLCKKNNFRHKTFDRMIF